MNNHPYGHITRYNFVKIRDIDNRDFQTGRSRPLDINNMIWEKDIYQRYETHMSIILEKPDYQIEKLDYAGYMLFFIREKRNKPYRDNLFWINTLPDGTTYDRHKDESLLIYRFDDWSKGILVKKNEQFFTAIQAGHIFTEYTKKHSNKNENHLWTDFKNQIQRENDDSKFLYSVFDKFIIVYKYLHK